MDNSLAFLVLTTLVIVPAMSYFVSRLQSLPVDMVAAAISLIIFSLDTFARSAGERSSTSESVYTIFLIIIISIVLAVFSLGAYLAIAKERQLKSIDDDAIGSAYIELGYCFSVFISNLFLVYSFFCAVSVPALFAAKEQHLPLFQVVADVVSAYSGKKSMLLYAGVIYFTLLLIRYGRHLSTIARNLVAVARWR